MFFFIIKTLECGVKLEIIHKITLKDTCTPQESTRKRIKKIQNYFLETLVAKCEIENGVLIERESREFQPHFLAQNLTKILILKG